MICRIRPRKPRVSDDAPMIATERGHSSFSIEGKRVSELTQSKPARDDAAQDFRGAALDGELGRDGGGEAELVFERRAVGLAFLDEGRKLAHAVGELLLPQRP